MPLDQRGFEIETKPDLSKPSLEGLSYLLRHLREEMPQHSYDHRTFAREHWCGTAGCALGICELRWPTDFYKWPNIEAEKIFGKGSYNRFFNMAAYNKHASLVTPLDVADAIDAYLRDRAQS